MFTRSQQIIQLLTKIFPEDICFRIIQMMKDSEFESSRAEHMKHCQLFQLPKEIQEMKELKIILGAKNKYKMEWHYIGHPSFIVPFHRNETELYNSILKDGTKNYLSLFQHVDENIYHKRMMKELQRIFTSRSILDYSPLVNRSQIILDKISKNKFRSYYNFLNYNHLYERNYYFDSSSNIWRENIYSTIESCLRENKRIGNKIKRRMKQNKNTNHKFYVQKGKRLKRKKFKNY